MLQESKYLIVLTTIILMIMVMTLVIVYSMFIQKKTELLMSQQEKELEFEKELSESLSEMKEQTLRNIGLELHDNIGQKLSVVSLRSNQLSSKLPDKDQQDLKEIISVLRECIQDIRNLSKTLNINDLDNFNLLNYFTIECERFKKLEFIQFHVNNDLEDPLQINPRHALIIYRMIQETLNNVYKHSEAHQVWVDFWEDEPAYYFNIKDNGKGFDTQATSKGKGLNNLKERARMIQAKYDINSALNKGTTTQITYYKNATT